MIKKHNVIGIIMAILVIIAVAGFTGCYDPSPEPVPGSSEWNAGSPWERFQWGMGYD